ncbi:heavy-metal-associated domain-containing protein [Acidiferrobacter thiooxydans]|uniref:heavy-metal-associated domain-containing protein n=1 Tax=Acidiferrobacter thiooxydans TaxID=163359 RepID=UPI000824E89B|nr:heavy metal-associated domain-containing protein [Acidiferrobacter thiooxydans]UEO00437.1 heavy-metal-associated domain-containing protein [Acidiferrobacter thiooxydans]
MAITDETFSVNGMSCPSCENRIARRLETVPGVSRASADHKLGRVRVLYNKEVTSNSALKAAIEGLGYEVAP